MKFKILIALLVVLVYSCTTDTKTSSSLVHYVPENTAFVIRINNLDSLKNQLNRNTIISKIKPWGNYENIVSKIALLKHLKENNKGLLCFSELGKEKFEFTYITSPQKNIVVIDSAITHRTETIAYENQEIKKITIADASYYLYHTNNSSFLSSSEVLIENLIRNQKKTNTNPILHRLYTMSNANKSASIFINLKKASSIINPLLKKESSLKIAQFADWVSLDLKLSANSLNFNGISITSDSVPNYLNLFKNTNPINNRTSELAPLHSDAIQSYTFDDYSAFAKNQQNFLDRSSPMDSLFNTVEEIGYIHINNQKAILINTYGAENIYDYLNANKKESYDYQGSEILELSNSTLLNNALSPVVKEYKAIFCSIIENAFVFAPNKDLIQTIINNYKNGATFNKTALFSSSNTILAEESSTLYLSGAKNLEHILKKHATETVYKDFKKSDFSKYAFVLQTAVDANFHHTNLNILPIKKEENTSIVSPLFSLQLDNEITSKPQFVTNHVTKKKEILVQDINNVLYLISDTGLVIWKKELQNPIQGKVRQVDLYKNGRLQLAFTTTNQFMILDRNGKEVAPFSMSFDGGNLNPLAVFDYEKKKEYRFLVTQGKKIFMYNSKGEIVKGFKLTKTKENIIAAPKHFVIKNKDYLVFKLENGNLKIVNRVGKDRVKVKNKIAFSENEIYVYKDRFNLSDMDGNLHQINTEGKDSKTALSLVKDHGLVTTSRTLVYMNDNTISIKGKKVELDLGVYNKPQIFLIHNKMYIGVTDIQNQNIYLFDSQANLLPNFPIFGTSAIDLIDMDGDKKPELVTKDNDNSIVVYKIH
ncbi:ribonuclease HII [uncultured Maribacter sp.]|uniref:ribonuclease HII n=1 Tax=uncultured Maribacter sp. TaxID=431308 RepID=UPI002628EC35|nr:ribonuclease HII [uncultured Maribacter sp.]